MKLEIVHQKLYNRGELLLRTFFGGLYIVLPHILVLIPLLIYGWLLWVYGTFYALLKGELPHSYRSFFTRLMEWGVRLHLSVYNMKDGYPKFGLNHRNTQFDFAFEINDVKRSAVLARFLIGPILLIPHFIVLSILGHVVLSLVFVAFFIVLFTRTYPEGLFNIQVGYLKWVLRIAEYVLYFGKEYPYFGLK